MEKEATKIFEIVLNNSASLIKEIRLQVYKLIELEGKTILPNANDNAKLLEQIKASIETFNFNSQENIFLSQIREIIKEEMQKFQTNRSYDLTEKCLIERLKKIKDFDLSLENDFKDLSSKITNSFHSQNEYYNYFMTKQEKISDMIKSYNQNIINALINLTPKLMNELRTENERVTSSITNEFSNIRDEKTTESISDSNTNSSKKNIEEQMLIDKIIAICLEKKKELDDMFYNPRFFDDKTQIAKISRQLMSFIEDLQKGYYNEQLIGVSDVSIESFIVHKIPALEELKKIEKTIKKTSDPNNQDMHQQLNDNLQENKEKNSQLNTYEEYLKRKKRIIDNFINSTTVDFANKICSTYPYSLEYSDVSPYREHFKSIWQIPAYPISEEEWDIIIEQINKNLSNFVDLLIKEDQLERKKLISKKQEETANNNKKIANTGSLFITESPNISPKSNSSYDGKLDDDLSTLIANEIKMDIFFDLIEKYNQGNPFIPINANDLKSQYNINDKIAQELAEKINTMVENYIVDKEKAKENYQPYILDEFEEEKKESMGKK